MSETRNLLTTVVSGRVGQVRGGIDLRRHALSKFRAAFGEDVEVVEMDLTSVPDPEDEERIVGWVADVTFARRPS